MTKLHGFLRRHRRIALDTSVFIYQVELNPRYEHLTGVIFQWLEGEDHSATTSTVTLTELLVQPYRNVDDARISQFYGVLTTFPNLDWFPPGLQIADTAARIRAVHRMQIPDALQAATAIESGATGLVTNDRVFERVKKFETLVLEDLL